jgi:ATP-dependent exoDNAse (exonuclease V) beta subunit
MEEGKFKVLKASAGSGKTYSLVKEYLLLALGAGKPDYYRHILALTFTNAAAAEMKERVLLALKNIAQANSAGNNLVADLKAKLPLSEDELQSKAIVVYKHMLHHYGQLSIVTIDSFTHRIVRTFARDLRLSSDFGIEMNTDSFVEQVVDECIDRIGQDPELTPYLRQIALDQLEDEKRWTLRNGLEEITKQVLKEDANEALKKLDHLSLVDFQKIRDGLVAKIKSYENYLKEIAQKALALIESKGLTKADFWQAGSGTVTKLDKIADGEFIFPKPRFFENILRDEWYSGKATTEAKAAIDSIQPQLKEWMQKVADELTNAKLAKRDVWKRILQNVYQVGLMARIHDIAEEIKEEENILLISDFHELVNEVVSENEAPFIYERLGNRYKHILFDEFQDTSVLQWNNAIPLVQNALSENNLSLIVGDGKQSIYRWRGGKAEQFVQLPNVHVQGIHADAEHVFKLHYTNENLDKNFRSAKSIIQFNNSFYEKLVAKMPEAAVVYKDHHQKEIKTALGYVQVKKFDSKNKKEALPIMLDEVTVALQDALAAGYRPCDVAILTRKGATEGGQIAAHLKQLGYQVQTKESFLLRLSPKVRAIMSYCAYTVNQGNHYAAVECARALCEINKRADFNDFVLKYMSRNPEKRHELKIELDAWINNCFGERPFQHLETGVYGMVVELLKYFSFTTDTYVEFLLDQIRQRCVIANASLAQLAEWWEDAQAKTYITSAPNQQAVQIMTIHKSKGLQFPVVIYPRFGSKNADNKIWINVDEEELGLSTALVRSSVSQENDIACYPKEFAEEVAKNNLDDLNLCYVATTRAEQRLYVLIASNSKNTALAKVIENVLQDNTENITEPNTLWEWGVRENIEIKVQADDTQVMQHQYTLGNDFVVRAKPLLSADIAERIGYGNLLHACFAQIKTGDDVPAAIQNTLQDFAATTNEEWKKKLQHDVHHVVQNELSKKWFTDFEEVFLERELIADDGTTHRPDRVVVYTDRVEVIDFKTGAPRSEHLHQVNEYVRLLSKFYNKQVHGEVVYQQ